MKWMRVIAIMLCALMPVAVHAHRSSDAFLTLEVSDRMILGQWEIAPRDLEAALGIDVDGDDQLTWGEVRQARARLESEVLPALTLKGEAGYCVLNLADLKLNDRVDGRFVWVEFAGVCGAPPSYIEIGYHFLSAMDPTHRGVLTLNTEGGSQTAILDPNTAARRFSLETASNWRALYDYLLGGVWHIWIGYDHILFLLALLVPSVLRYSGSSWEPQARLQPVILNVLSVVTAFTLAHSITLSLAALDLLRLPTKVVECTIAISVAVAAANNIWPIVRHSRWVLAFGFG